MQVGRYWTQQQQTLAACLLAVSIHWHQKLVLLVVTALARDDELQLLSYILPNIQWYYSSFTHVMLSAVLQ